MKYSTRILLPKTRVFILAQTLDIAMTFAILRFNLAVEMNPFGFTPRLILTKFFVIIFVVYVLERFKMPKISWIIPGFSVLICVWNAFSVGIALLLWGYGWY